MRRQPRFLILLICLVFSIQCLCFATPTYPQPTSSKYVNDYVGILDNATHTHIVSIGKELEDLTSAQVVVAIIDSTEGVPIADYALQLFRTWGVGQAGSDNGILILFAINDRTWRVEVGRGLEGAIPDALANRIMESLAVPELQQGRYAQGVLNSYSTIADTVAGEYQVTLTKSPHITLPNNRTASTARAITPFLGVLLLLDLIFNRGRFTGSFLQILFISNLTRRGGPRGGGGGFGGFGGGSSGGGGASGDW